MFSHINSFALLSPKRGTSYINNTDSDDEPSSKSDDEPNFESDDEPNFESDDEPNFESDDEPSSESDDEQSLDLDNEPNTKSELDKQLARPFVLYMFDKQEFVKDSHILFSAYVPKFLPINIIPLDNYILGVSYMRSRIDHQYCITGARKKQENICRCSYEKIEDAMVRELSEELGIVPIDQKHIQRFSSDVCTDFDVGCVNASHCKVYDGILEKDMRSDASMRIKKKVAVYVYGEYDVLTTLIDIAKRRDADDNIIGYCLFPFERIIQLHKYRWGKFKKHMISAKDKFSSDFVYVGRT